MDDRLLYVPLLLSALAFIALTFYQPPEPGWETTQLEEDVDGRFLDLERAGGELYVFYRNSSRGGIKVASAAGSPGPLSLWTRDWSTQVIDSQPGSGASISAAEVAGRPAVVYQDATVGSEKVIYASLRDGWSTEEVANVRTAGANVGMYTGLTSHQGRPVVLYHSPVRGLVGAVRSGGEWSKAELGGEQGWFIDAASCESTAFAAYRGRNSQEVTVASYDGSWSTTALNVSAKSAIALESPRCQKHLAYLRPGTESVVYRSPAGEPESLVRGSDRSKISLDVNDNTSMVYYEYGSGLFYAEKAREGWNREMLGNWTEMAMSSGLEVLPSRDVVVAHVEDSDLVVSELDRTGPRTVETATDLASALFAALTLLMAAGIYRRTGFEAVLQLLRRLS